MLPFHANHREVGSQVRAYYFGVVLPWSRLEEFHLQAVSLVDHVVVGQDVAGRVHYHAGTERFTTIAHFGQATAAPEGIAEVAEEINSSPPPLPSPSSGWG